MENKISLPIWPEWQIEKQIGRGSYGVVYQAVRKDHNMENYAAIKVISIPQDKSEVDSLRSEGLTYDASRTYFQGVVNDFVSEIQLMESIKGIQNIVSVEDYKVVEKSDGIGWDIFIRMELLTSFNNFICNRKMTENDVIKLGCDICTALEVCAKRNIIHRDIKPENIFVNDFGDYKLGDFGIARKLENATSGLSQKGTFNYMAPEVVNGTSYDARVDIYSLGIMLYRMLNGNRLPFLMSEQQLMNPNERKLAVERRIRGELLPAPCDASHNMATVILKACAFNPGDRFSTALEMKTALLAVSNGTYQDVSFAPQQPVTFYSPNMDGTNRTVSVRRAPENLNNGNQQVDSFGTKKTKKPKIIIAICIFLLVLGGGIFGLSNSEDTDQVASNTDDLPEISPTILAELSPTSEPELVITDIPEDLPTSTPEPVPTDSYIDDSEEDLPTFHGRESGDSSNGTLDDEEDSNVPAPTEGPLSDDGSHVHSYNEDYVCTICEEAEYTQGLVYELHNLGTYYIVTGMGTAYGNVLIIPPEFNGKPVKEIAANAFKDQSKITKLVIPTTIKKIGQNAFTNMISLKELEFNAIECEDLSYDTFNQAGTDREGIKVTFGEEVTRIPARLFWCYYDSKQYVNVSSVTFKGNNVYEIGFYAFNRCKNLGEIAIPEGVKYIGENAFSQCAGTQKIVIPSTVKSIGKYAFSYTIGLTELEFNAIECPDIIEDTFNQAGTDNTGINVIIGPEVTRIPARLFWCYSDNRQYVNATSLTFLGDKVTEIGFRAFDRCKNLTEVILPEGLKVIGEKAFNECAGTTTLVIPSTVKSVAKGAFSYMISLTELEFNAIQIDNLIDDTFTQAGTDNTGLYVTFGETVTQIPSRLFSCYNNNKEFVNATSITFNGNNITIIGLYAFRSCKKLTSIEIPKGVKTIGEGTFADCYSLTDVVLKDPNGWKIGDKEITNLNDSKAAATYLVNTYSNKVWTK